LAEVKATYREVVFEREGREPLHGFMRVDRGMVIVTDMAGIKRGGLALLRRS
jgi:hypothetical protein